MYNRKDYYYKKAKEEGRASRASYKLEQIQAKYRIVKKGDVVIDLGCAPGGWLEVLSEMVGDKGLVVGIDILPTKIQPRKNIIYIQGDVSQTEEILRQIKGCLTESSQQGATSREQKTVSGEQRTPARQSISGGTNDERRVDVILSDMAPNTSGVAFKDCYLSYELCLMALETAKKLLKEGGNFVAKIFQGGEVETFKKELRQYFRRVEIYIPPATREGSRETYLIAISFRRPV